MNFLDQFENTANGRVLLFVSFHCMKGGWITDTTLYTFLALENAVFSSIS